MSCGSQRSSITYTFYSKNGWNQFGCLNKGCFLVICLIHGIKQIFECFRLILAQSVDTIVIGIQQNNVKEKKWGIIQQKNILDVKIKQYEKEFVQRCYVQSGHIVYLTVNYKYVHTKIMHVKQEFLNETPWSLLWRNDANIRRWTNFLSSKSWDLLVPGSRN